MGKRADGKNIVEKELVVEVVGIYRNFFVSQKIFYNFNMISPLNESSQNGGNIAPKMQ